MSKESVEENEDPAKPAESKGETATFADVESEIIGDLDSSRHEVSEPPELQTVDEQSQPGQVVEPPKLTGSGETFNPDIHISDDAGNPLLTKTGKYRKKRGWKKFVNPEQPEAVTPEPQNSKMLATFSTVTYLQAGTAAFGSDFGVDRGGEHDNLRLAFEAYFDSVGMVDVPPGIALCMALSVHAYTHTRTPTAKQRIGRVGAKIKGFFASTLRRGKPIKPVEKPVEKT